MSAMIEKLRAKVAGNPLLSLLASAAVTYATTKYGPAIDAVKPYICK